MTAPKLASCQRRYAQPGKAPITADGPKPPGAVAEVRLADAGAHLLFVADPEAAGQAVKILADELGIPKKDLFLGAAGAQRFFVGVHGASSDLMAAHGARIASYLHDEGFVPNLKRPASGPEMRYLSAIETAIAILPRDTAALEAVLETRFRLGREDRKTVASYLLHAAEPAKTITACEPLHRMLDAAARRAAFPGARLGEGGLWVPEPGQVLPDGTTSKLVGVR